MSHTQYGGRSCISIFLYWHNYVSGNAWVFAKLASNDLCLSTSLEFSSCQNPLILKAYGLCHKTSD